MSDQQPPQNPSQPNDGAGQQPPVPPVPPVAPIAPPVAPVPPPGGGYALPPAGGYAPTPGYGVPQAPAPQTNNNAIVAFVLALVSWVICPIIPAIVALVFASKGKKEIEQSGGWQTGEGFVTAAKIISWLNIVFYPLIIIGTIALMIILGAATSDFGTPYPTYTRYDG